MVRGFCLITIINHGNGSQSEMFSIEFKKCSLCSKIISFDQDKQHRNEQPRGKGLVTVLRTSILAVWTIQWNTPFCDHTHMPRYKNK